MNFKNYNIVDGFNIIAPAYDLANDAMTFGLHRLWRRVLVREALARVPKGGKVLDVATGTGDVILGLLKERTDIRVVGLDPSEGMLKVAREKFAKTPLVPTHAVDLVTGDARQLPFPNDTFDSVTISWGIRNVRPHAEGLREMLRVLKPGGSLVVLESGRPELKAVELAYRYYARLLPHIGGRIAGYLPAYKYYTHTVDEFPTGKAFVAELHECGFTKPSYRTLGGSIVYLYTAQKPSQS
ncbi:MAG: ubiquinone/menaquinone biosynthesis methyltransferase [Silvanigrellales bacterium]|nr:ubiquinone/menaquinone biosynthesis methyltransferase [Silvanigrellales bacterium]